MIAKVKKWLGIEGVKVELILPESIRAKDGFVNGSVRLTSMNDQTVTYLKVTMIERYSRGRKGEKLADEYKIGEIELSRAIQVPANQPIDIEFTLPFELVKSNVENFADKNVIFKSLSKMAKTIYAVRSEFRVEAVATVTGVALNPFDRKSIKLK